MPCQRVSIDNCILCKLFGTLRIRQVVARRVRVTHSFACNERFSISTLGLPNYLSIYLSVCVCMPMLAVCLSAILQLIAEALLMNWPKQKE